MVQFLVSSGVRQRVMHLYHYWQIRNLMKLVDSFGSEWSLRVGERQADLCDYFYFYFYFYLYFLAS